MAEGLTCEGLYLINNLLSKPALVSTMPTIDRMLKEISNTMISEANPIKIVR